MKYVISGASAQIGQLVISKLLKKIDPTELTLISRNPSQFSVLAKQGVTLHTGHHGDAKSLTKGYEGADALLMISSRAGGKRAAHHKASIEVAKRVGVKHITYTSVAGAHLQNPTPSAADHVGTEYHLYDSGLSFAALRNQTYHELLYNIIKNQALPKNRFIMNCLRGAFSPISRADIANCAAAIMLSPEKHQRVTYEITGPERLTWPEIIELGSKVWETNIEYVSISTQKMLEIMAKVGIPFKGNPDSEIMAQSMGAEELALQADGWEMGFLDILSAHVEIITGNKPQSLESFLRQMKASEEK
jgi:NAD(P)H dehydrogenase (quinone)